MACLRMCHRTNLGRGIGIDAQRCRIDEGSVRQCVWRGRIKGEDIVGTVRGDENTMGGERTAVEFFINMIFVKV